MPGGAVLGYASDGLVSITPQVRNSTNHAPWSTNSRTVPEEHAMIFSIVPSSTDRSILRDVIPHSAMNFTSSLQSQDSSSNRRGSPCQVLSGPGV